MRIEPDLADVRADSSPVDSRIREAFGRFSFEAITSADDPWFDPAYALLGGEWAASGGLEPRSVVAGYVSVGGVGFERDGIWVRPHLVVALDRDGTIAGVRDGHTTIDAEAGRCVVFLAHALVRPAWRRSGLAALMRALPVTLARAHVAARTGGSLPTMLAAEMDPVGPSRPDTIVRLVAYGKGGFSAIPPAILPYAQPDFRPSEQTGGSPRVIAQLAVVRRLGHEADGTLPIGWARAFLRHVHAVHGSHAASPVLEQAAQRAKEALDRHGSGDVPLLRLPTSPTDRDALSPLLQSRVWGALPEALRPWGETVPAVDDELAALYGASR